MQLYNISEEAIKSVISNVTKIGNQIIIKKITGHQKLIKVVIDVQLDSITVITAYPLRRGLQ